MATSTTCDKWNVIDFTKLDAASISSLPAKERQALYTKITESFTIITSIDDKTNTKKYEYKGLKDKKFGCRLTSISFKTELLSITFFFIFMAMFFVPVGFIFIAIYLLYNHYWLTFIIYLIIYLILILYPIEQNKEFLQNSIFYSILNYFCYRHVIHEECHEYIRNHLLNNTEYRPIIFISIPHGVVPLSSSLSPLVSPDIFKTAAVGTVASVVFYIPFIRNIASWYGAKSVSKASLIQLLSKNLHVGLICDGIRGMFVKSDTSEIVLLKNRKGVAKLALQNGAHVAPTYGFGNTVVYNSLFDKFGLMQWISGKIKMSVILFYGRWYTLIPNRIPLYFVIGKPVYNKYCNQQIINPTQQQIDDYHELILKQTQEMFDQHKSIYNWHHKQLIFV